MSHPIKVGIIGFGCIGKAIAKLFEMHRYPTTYDTTSYDADINAGAMYTIAGTDEELEQAVIDNDIIVCCTPFFVNQRVANFCIKHEKAYFDLTEDNANADIIRKQALLSHNPKVHVMSQCGLAPGAVSIIGADMISVFEKVEKLEIRVGSLPINANNDMKYYLTWSPDGLINEYNHPCKAVKDGQSVSLQPLEGLESITIDGVTYEAFNTSGGIGTLTSNPNFAHIENINYKTMRYPGHRDKMWFLFNDLNLRNHQELLVDIFKKNVAYNRVDDLVIIFIQATGFYQGRREVRQYVHKVYGEYWMTAIEKTTAGGVCAAIDWFVNSPGEKPIVMLNESIPYDQIKDNQFWKVGYGKQ